jgi:oligopeptide transport system ATP-binding protein
MDNNVLLEVKNIKTHFPVTKGIFSRIAGHVHAVDGIDFKVKRGSTLGIVGESGCGKTTAGKTITRLLEPTEGQIIFDGKNITKFSKKNMKNVRQKMQMIFQDPFSSLNPKLTVASIVGASLEIHNLAPKSDREAIITDLLKKVGLQPDHMKRYPHQFSGGQRQRIGIARALASNPELIIADEPLSALDVSIQAQIINLLEDLQKDLGLTYVVISHDLAVLSHISDEVVVMYLGVIVEHGLASDIMNKPKHPYTQALLSALPIPDPLVKRKRTFLEGDVPSPINPPSGCRFHPRCPQRIDACDKQVPEPVNINDNHIVACHLIGQ